MSDTNEAQPQGGQIVAEGNTATQQPAPRNDTEAARQEADRSPQQPEQSDAEKAATQKAEQEVERRKNRTKAYIERLQSENAEMARRLRESVPQRPTAEPAQPQRREGAPTMEQYNFDPEAYARAVASYEVQQALKERDEKTNSDAAAEKQHKVFTDYQRRAMEFAAEHDDFIETVGTIDPQLLTNELQAAIMAHEKGPQIAYQLAQDEDGLFSLASTRPELLERAVARYASRLSDAQPNQEPPATPAAPAAIAPQQPIKPISQAPAPPPRVGGRSPTETPPEKMTDDQWYAREREKRRKR